MKTIVLTENELKAMKNKIWQNMLNCTKDGDNYLTLYGQYMFISNLLKNVK